MKQPEKREGPGCSSDLDLSTLRPEHQSTHSASEPHRRARAFSEPLVFLGPFVAGLLYRRRYSASLAPGLSLAVSPTFRL